MVFNGSHLGKAVLLGAALLFLVTGCTPSFGGSRHRTVEWAGQHGFVARDIEAGGFKFLALLRDRGDDETLGVYLEGDGAAWFSTYQPPVDPTPDHPLALTLAAADPAPRLVYLGRPCQYLTRDELAVCDPYWWTEGRFAAEVLFAYQQVLDRLLVEFGAGQLALRGHSGGGVLAMLLAGRRQDVKEIITVAAPLAVKQWVDWHGVSPLAGSLDPMTEPGKVPPAGHWVGGADWIVPPEIVAAYISKKGGRLLVVPGYDHQCCWADEWARRLKSSL